MLQVVGAALEGVKILSSLVLTYVCSARFWPFFFLPHIGRDIITLEDINFRLYLENHGWDTKQMGNQEHRMACNPALLGGGQNEVIV